MLGREDGMSGRGRPRVGQASPTQRAAGDCRQPCLKGKCKGARRRPWYAEGKTVAVVAGKVGIREIGTPSAEEQGR
jgi:hypothetical protein